MAEYRVRQLLTRVGDDLHVKDSKATRGSKSNCYYCGLVSNHVLLLETRKLAVMIANLLSRGNRSRPIAFGRRTLCRPQIAIGTFRGPCRVHLSVTVVFAKTLSGREITDCIP